MSPQKISKLSYRWQCRIYLIGCLLCVGVLGTLGLWIYFQTPDPTPDTWVAETIPLEEERAGYSGGSAHIAPGFPSNGELHNEGTRPSDTTRDALGAVPTPGASLKRPAQSEQAQAIASASPKPRLANREADTPTPTSEVQAAHFESGLGVITITALMPGARIDVADHVITKAPTTLQVPWPANYTLAVQVDEATVYETRIHLSAENNSFSFAVNAVADPALDPVAGID